MATEAVLKYLQTTNRPYSANDILQNLHKEYSKGQIQKSLDELSTIGSIFEKVYGKQKVYCIKQDDIVIDNDDELNELNSKITSATELLKELKTELTTVENELKTILNEPTTKTATIKCKELIETNRKFEEKIKLLKESTDLIPDNEKQTIIKMKNLNLNEYKKRKRICLNILNEILESYPKSKKILFEEIGIDEDGDQVLDKIQ